MGSLRDDCVFCKIIAGTSPAWVVYEDEHSIAFLDSKPIAPGHILVCPKMHAERLTQLQGEMNELNATLRRIAHLVEERLSADYNIGANQGPKAGQVVFHHHWHVIPRRQGDGSDWERKRLTPEAAEETFRLLGIKPLRRP